MELVRTESNIKTGYRNILAAFTLRNIFTTVTSELSATSIIGTVLTLGKSWFSRRKKKRGRKAEDRGRKTEVGGRKSEDESRRLEDGGRKSEDGGQRTQD